MNDSNSVGRRYAALALGSLKVGKAVLPLLEILKNDKNPYVIEYTIIALGEIGNPISVEHLITVLKETKQMDWRWRDCRYESVKALGKIRDSKAFDALIMVLKDPDLNVRRKALFALGKIGDIRAIEPIEELLQNENESLVIKAAKEALKTLTRN